MVKNCIVSSCIIIRNGRTLLLKHKKLNIWLYPGGHIDDGETPIESAIREAREETGFRVRIVGKKRLKLRNSIEATEQPRPIAVLYEDVPYKEGRHTHFDLVYLAKPVGAQAKVAYGESTDLKWISARQVDSLDTYENVKAVLKLAFDIQKNRE